MIKEISLKNFLSYDDQIVKFNKNMNCFFGLNGAGKSNLIEIINFLKNDVNYDNFANIKKKKEEKNINISITLEKDIEILNEIFESIEKINGLPKIEIDNKKNYEIKISKILFDNQDVNYEIAINDLFKKNNDISNSLDEKKNIHFSILFSKKQLTNQYNSGLYESYLTITIDSQEFKIQNYNFNDLIKKIFNKFIIWKPKKFEFIESIKINNIEDLYKEYSFLFNIFNAHDKENNTIFSKTNIGKLDYNECENISNQITDFLNEKIEKIWPEFSKEKKIIIRINSENKQINLSVKSNNKNVYDQNVLKKESDGINQFLSIILRFCFVEFDNLYVFIDEPETHLHLGAIDYLFKELLNLSKKYNLFIFTHSPEFFNLNLNYLDNFYIESKIENQNIRKSKIHNINQEFLNKFNLYNELFKFIFGKNIIWNNAFFKNIVFVEGYTDQKIFNKLSLMYKKDILFLPINGGNSLVMINLYKELFSWDDKNLSNFLLIVDKDKGGDEIIEKIKNDNIEICCYRKINEFYENNIEIKNLEDYCLNCIKNEESKIEYENKKKNEKSSYFLKLINDNFEKRNNNNNIDFNKLEQFIENINNWINNSIENKQ